jgi:hypothetical protein
MLRKLVRSNLVEMVMNDLAFRKNIARLTEQLAFETAGLKRQKLARQIKKKLAVMDQGPLETPPVKEGDYWKSRAERIRRRAQRCRSDGFRDHLLKIAAGYDELAKAAYAAEAQSEVRQEIDS